MVNYLEHVLHYRILFPECVHMHTCHAITVTLWTTVVSNASTQFFPPKNVWQHGTANQLQPLHRAHFELKHF